MVQRALRALGRLSKLGRTGLLAGLLAALILAPLAVGAGVAARQSIALFDELPVDLRLPQVGQTSYVYASDNQTLITTFYEEHRKFTPIDEMSPLIVQAIVASEDARFYDHNGVDLKGIARAFVANQQEGEVSQGGSTLTMQYVRMSLRDSATSADEALSSTEQTTERKLREIRLAVELEKQWTKEKILEGYLNAAYFGHRAYGIFAAAQIFFSKLPKDLTLPEAATLAGLVKAPSAYDPASNDQTAATDRRNYIISRMAELGYVSPDTAATATAQPISLQLTDPPNDCSDVSGSAVQDWGFFCDFFKSWWLKQDAFGDSPQARMDKLKRGGYRIVTSLDPALMASAMQSVLAKESVDSRLALGVVVVQPGTGRVTTMATNRVYSLDQSANGSNSDPNKRDAGIPGSFPNTVAPILGGGDLPGYQAGSTFKMFTMLAALDKGHKLSTKISSPQRLVSIYPGEPGERGSCGNRWCPSNASGAMTGVQTMWTGFGKSVNTYFVQLEQMIGAEAAVRMAERIGLTWHTDIDREMASPERANGWGSFTLGVADTTPLEMANAYATIASDGAYCEPSAVVSITGPDGKPATFTDDQGNELEAAAPKCRSAFSPDVARAAADAARCVTGYKAAKGSCAEWSTAPGVYGAVGRPVAGKTGTTDDTRSAWFVGVTPQLAAASFIADPDYPFNFAGDGNSQKPVMAVADVLREGSRDLPWADFNPPGDSIL
jgi:membrane peptidoglycan carboxypeptidase